MNQTAALTHTYPQTASGKDTARWLAVVAAAHVALVAWVAWMARPALDSHLSVMSVQILRVAPPVEAPPKPKPKPPKPRPPKPIEKPQVKRVISQEPAPVPIPEKRPEPEPKPEPVKEQPKPAPEPDPAPPPAVVPPRFDADYLNNPAPRYPQISRRLNESGKVLLRVQVGPDGRAVQVLLHRTSGYPRLDDAAREAVSSWRFVPARRGNDALTEWVIVPISFNLTR